MRRKSNSSRRQAPQPGVAPPEPLSPQLPVAPSLRHEFDISDFARQRLGFHPDPQQSRALDPRIRRGLLNCCRQWGKSTTISVRAVFHAFHHAESLTIVVSPTARQSAEFVRKASQFLVKLGIAPRGDGDNEISLLLPNAARIVGLPGSADTIRGFSNVGLLLIDEASRVPDALYHAVRPMVAANRDAAIWLLSTPNGRQGFFYEEWCRPDSPESAAANWVRIQTPATECARILPGFLEEERRSLTDQMFRQEYLCEFSAADHSYFDPDSVDDAFNALPEPLRLGEDE